MLVDIARPTASEKYFVVHRRETCAGCCTGAEVTTEACSYGCIEAEAASAACSTDAGLCLRFRCLVIVILLIV